MQVFELLDHCKLLNGEVDDLQREVFALRRKVCQAEATGGIRQARGLLTKLAYRAHFLF
jgi:hypothetical protein